MSQKAKLREYHAAVWDEPVVMEMGGPGRRGLVFREPEKEVSDIVGTAKGLVPRSMYRTDLPNLPELSEQEVQRHYLHLSQETLGMMGISLFGTCTMKYNPRLNEIIASRPEVSETHPLQHQDTLQGTLELIHNFDLILRELSGMDNFAFQAGGGAHAAYTHCCITRAYHKSRGQLEQRNEVITSIQAHPCNPATAAAAGFHVITLPLEEDGYPSVDALRAAVSDRTAALLINNPDDMGIYNPHIADWVEIVHEAGGLCFYDHANFNGVMGKIRARELGFDACMYMLHKTFGAPKGGGGPAVGAYGCTAELAPFLPSPVVTKELSGYGLDYSRPNSVGHIREFWGNVPQVIKAYSWARAMGAVGIERAAEISVIANNYMESRLLKIRGVTKSHPTINGPRMEMTRYSLERLTEETGVTVNDVSNRMVDFGIDAPWLAHHPWLVPEPITPEAGESYSKEDLDYWIDVLAEVVREAYETPEIVKKAPHRQAIPQINGDALDEPEKWAMTWRAYCRKHRNENG
ncbi:MAG: glycine dehydrogenase subunit 2 [Acidiferrobacteraceae bacterium]|mgnify:CR=1 FL=1|nr:glycine dehydrogenase subunit 2 [Acidiferrobacteraceae bacterium]